MKKNINKPAAKKRWDAITENLNCQAELVGAEIGVEQGKTSKVLLSRISKLKLYLVDRWIVTPPGDSYFNGSRVMARYNKQQWGEVYNKAMANVAPYKNRITIIRKDSQSAALDVPDGSLNFIFIDADHSYDGVCRDIASWMPKLKPGGIAFFHDFGNKNTLTGVKQAIEDKLGQGVELSYDHVAIWRTV